MKKTLTYFNEKGQDLVEYTLILAFCAVMLLGLNSDDFHSTFRKVFEKGVFDDVKTVIAAGNPYSTAIYNWSQSSRRTLAVVEQDPATGKWVLKEDVIPNADRLETDRQALYNIADFFLGMDITTLSHEVFRDEFKADSGYFTKGSDILLLSYTDSADVENNYNTNTQKYDKNDSATTNITIATEGRRYAASEVIHWMQGDYGNYRDTNKFEYSSYDSSKEFDSTKRYFYSNEMIDPDPANSKNNSLKRNIRVNFTITDGVVTGVKVRAQQNGRDVSDLKIEKTL